DLVVAPDAPDCRRCRTGRSLGAVCCQPVRVPGPGWRQPGRILADIDQHASIAYQSVVLMYVSSLLFAPALLSLAGLVRGRGATLAFVATCVLAWASSATPWAVFHGVLTIDMAAPDLPRDQMATVIERLMA